MGPVFQLRRVSRVFQLGGGMFGPRRDLRALDGIDLDLHQGEILALVGESGSGKSTLSRILLNLDRPTEGEVLFHGQPVETVPRRDFARRVQPVFQDPYSSLNPRRTVREIIEMPLIIQGGTPAPERRRRIRDLLDLMRMPARVLEAYPAQMSGGQRQRVAIARAIVSRPEVVICDEPTSALDVSVQAQVLNLLMELRAELGLTYLFITHDLAVVQYIADRVAVMQSGRLVEEGETERLFAAPREAYTRELLDSATVLPERLG